MARSAILQISPEGPASYRAANSTLFVKGRQYPMSEAEARRYDGHPDFTVTWIADPNPPEEKPWPPRAAGRAAQGQPKNTVAAKEDPGVNPDAQAEAPAGDDTKAPAGAEDAPAAKPAGARAATEKKAEKPKAEKPKGKAAEKKEG